MRLSSISRRTVLGGFVVVLLAMTGCGGGSGAGGNGTAPVAAAGEPSAGQAPPAAPEPPASVAPESQSVSFVSYASGTVAATTVTPDAEGNFVQNGTTYQLRAGTSDCSMSANPPDRHLQKCNSLAGGKGFIVCESANIDVFERVLFRTGAVEKMASWQELDGKTLDAASCGDTGLRQVNGSTVTFHGYPGSAEEVHVGPGVSTSNTYLTNNLVALFTEPGAASNSMSAHHRWVLYKASAGSSTSYFLLDLYQAPVDGGPGLAPKIYTLQVQ